MPQPTEESMSGFLETLDLPQLNKEHIDSINAPFTIKVLTQAISSLTNGKAPGPDDFTAEYYEKNPNP